MPLSHEYIREVQPQLPLLSSLKLGLKAYSMVAVVGLMHWFQEWYRYLNPSEYEPSASKTYKTRSHLPVRIFIPVSHLAKSPTASLPTLFTIHGGGFTIGAPRDDDKWNRMFADTHEILVIALNYSKAPFHPFPTAIHDLEALVLAILADSSLPVDKKRCGIAGFSAGGNLALVVAQLEDIKTAFKQHGSPGFSAVVPVYPGTDRTIARDHKATLRQYKSALTPNRNSARDLLLSAGKVFDWAYIPAGQDLRDPLISPTFAPRHTLPNHIFMIACELDMSSHDAWRMACRLAGRKEPGMDEISGREECGEVGKLELENERFAWEEGERGVRWLLVPDVVHGFDHLPPLMQGDTTSVRDAEVKTVKVIKEIGNWLKTRVWPQ